MISGEFQTTLLNYDFHNNKGNNTKNMPLHASQNAIERKHSKNLQHILIDREINGALRHRELFLIFDLLKNYKLQKSKKWPKNEGLTDIWSYKN